jgi:c-di-GMP-binding flagellar brake protein YcgR
MRIWTTPAFAKFVPIEDFQVNIFSEETIRGELLLKSACRDIAIMELDEDYLEFLATAKAKGIECPVIYISPEPTILQENIHLYNAIILDLKKIGAAHIKSIVNFIIRNATGEGQEGLQQAPAAPDITWAKPPEDRPVHDVSEIKAVLTYNLKEASPVVIAFQIPEDDVQVTVRGICNIRAIRDNAMVLSHFKPTEIPNGLKEGSIIRIFLSHISRNYEAMVKTTRITEDQVATSIPDNMFAERRRYVRVEPSPRNPLILHMLLENEPTVPLKATDISLHGMGFLIARDLLMGNIYCFSIILPEPQATILCYGIVRFKKEVKDTFLYGVEFNIHPKDEENIAQYIMKREFEITDLLRGR